MSAPAVPSTTAWQWPSEVLELATKHGVQGSLDALLEATRRQFPTASRVLVYTEDDAEDPGLRFLVFEVHVPQEDIPNYAEAAHAWNKEMSLYIPRPHTCAFVFSLNPVAS